MIKSEFGSIKKIENFFLQKYDEDEYILYQKARISLYLTVVVLLILAIGILYSLTLQKKLMPGIIYPELAGFLIMASTLFILHKGYYRISSHILLIIGMSTTWMVIFFDTSVPVTRLDTVAFILAMMVLSSLLLHGKNILIFIYAFFNITIMILFVYFNYDLLETTHIAKIDWIADTSLAIIFIAIFGYNIYLINQRALSRTEDELGQRLAAEKNLHIKNLELQASMEELEASNEEFEAMNEELMYSQIELRESEEKFRLIAEKSRIGVIIAQDERIRYVNQAVADIIGYSIDEMTAWDAGEYAKILPSEAIDDFMRTARDRQNGAAPGGINEEICMISRDGTYKWLEVNSTTVNFQGKPAELVAVLDISERKTTQEIMVQTEKMISIGGLSAGMAHEINNPLGIILQGIQNTQRRFDPRNKKNQKIARKYGIDLEKLQDYMVAQNISSYLSGIREAGNRASNIVANMLQFSRRSSGTPEAADIELIIEKALSIAEKDYDLQKSYDFKKIKIEKKYAPDLPPIECIETEIEQVLLNLLKNAAQAMSYIKEEPFNPHIIITTKLYDEGITIEIDDNGPGIPEETLKHIFDPFFTTKEIGHGTGLGLSVTYFIITDHHNGKISARSFPGKGTVFTINLPFQQRP